MPRPPPPNAALTSSGKPIRLISASSGGWSPSIVMLGSTGTPAAAISSLAAILEPIASMASGGGPTKISPPSAQAWANAAFSDRKP